MKRKLADITAILLIIAAAGCGAGDLGEEKGGTESSTIPDIAAGNRAEDSRPVIVALGDSLTAGYGVDPAESYPAKIQEKIDGSGLRYRVINAGVSGDTSAQGLNRLQAIRHLRPTVVIVALGGNDGLRGIPTEVTRQNLERIITVLLQDGTTVVLAGMRLPPNYGPQFTTSFHTIYLDLAQKHRISLVPFLLEGVGGVARLNLSDGIHPTAEGYNIVTANVWRVLEPILK